ncbi:hypothetical protein ACFWGZ_36160, partial [Lentzea sp. NPDC060358]
MLARAVAVLPDVRSVRAVWRSSPTGSTPGPLPQRVVLVDVGPQGFPPATAYRIDTMLRKAGVRAAVEVLTTGTQLGEYHAAAMTSSQQVPISSAAAMRVAEPVSPQGAWFDQSED